MIVILGVLGLGAWYVFSSGKDGAYAATSIDANRCYSIFRCNAYGF